MMKKGDPAKTLPKIDPERTFSLKRDGFVGSLYQPERDKYPGKALICFSGSDGKYELTRKLAAVFQSHGLTTLALAYVMEEGLPDQFYHVPIDMLETAAKRLHDMGYDKVGLWGISKGAELALTAASLLPGIVNAVVAVAPISTVCQGFSAIPGRMGTYQAQSGCTAAPLHESSSCRPAGS